MIRGSATGLCFLVVMCVLYAGKVDAVSGSMNCPRHLPRSGTLRTFRRHCYEFYVNELYWDEAQSYCYKRGGNLVQIRDHSTQLFIMLSLRMLKWPRNGLWIGAHDRHQEGRWLWVTGDRVTWGYWESGQPSCVIFCHEDCAVLRVNQGGRWHDYACHFGAYHYSFICQYDMIYRPPPPTTPTTTATTTTTTTTPTATTTTTPTTTTPTTTTTQTTTSTPTTTTTTTPTTTTTQTTTTTPTTTTTNKPTTTTTPTTTLITTTIPTIQATTTKPTETTTTDATIKTSSIAETSTGSPEMISDAKSTTSQSTSTRKPAHGTDIGFRVTTLFSTSIGSTPASTSTGATPGASVHPADTYIYKKATVPSTSTFFRIYTYDSDRKDGSRSTSTIGQVVAGGSQAGKNITSPIIIPVIGSESGAGAGPSPQRVTSKAHPKDGRPSSYVIDNDSGSVSSRQVKEGSNNGNSNNSVIIGGALGSISLLILIFSVLWFYKKRRAKLRDNAGAPDWSISFDNPGYRDAKIFLKHNATNGRITSDNDAEARRGCNDQHHDDSDHLPEDVLPSCYENVDRILSNANTFQPSITETVEQLNVMVPPLCAVNPLYDDVVDLKPVTE